MVKCFSVLKVIHEPSMTREHKEPESDLNIPTSAKKSLINWIVPAICAALVFAVFTVVKAWADDRYILRTTADSRLAAVTQSVMDEQKKRESLSSDMQEMSRKLDLIIYILQHDGKLSTQDMKGKLSPP